MNRYSLHCTEEQTRKALELGAPIETVGIKDDRPSVIYGFVFAIIPTAEQMINWLEEKGQSIEVSRLYRNNPNWSIFVDDTQIVGKYYSTRKDAIIASIDFALEYLINNKNNNK